MMTEKEYILISNIVKISDALILLNGILGGNNSGIDEHLLASALTNLDKVAEKLREFELIGE
jgi:hypothetical protein